MKTITFNESNISAYKFEDLDNTTSSAQNITCPEFIIGDMNSTNATIHENVTPPVDWQGGKYTFDGTTWAIVDGWVDPKLAEISRLEDELTALKAGI